VRRPSRSQIEEIDFGPAGGKRHPKASRAAEVDLTPPHEKQPARRKFASKVQPRQRPARQPSASSGPMVAPAVTAASDFNAAVVARRKQKPRRASVPAPNTDLYTVMFQTRPPVAALQCEGVLQLQTDGEAVMLELEEAELLDSIGEHPVFQLHAAPVKHITSVMLTKKVGVHFHLIGLHISSTGGAAFRNATGVDFAGGRLTQEVPGAARLPPLDTVEPTAGPADATTHEYSELDTPAEGPTEGVSGNLPDDHEEQSGAESPEDVEARLQMATSKEKVEQVLRRARKESAHNVEAELDVQLKKMDHFEEAWLSELKAEEDRVIGAMESTGQVLETLHAEDVSAGLMVREFESYVAKLEQQRNELRKAVTESLGDLDSMTKTKSREEHKVVALDADIERAAKKFMVEKTRRNKFRDALRVLEAEVRACEQGLLEMEAEATSYAAEEALARAAVVEEEDMLAQLLIEEQDLLAFSRSKEMEEAAKLAKQHLESLERNRALRELSERKADGSAAAERPVPMKRTAIQHLLEADIVGVDDVLGSGAHGISDETRLAAAESQVRMLEEKLHVADAHLKFAEATSGLLAQYPNSTGVLLEELQRYEANLADAGLLDDGELSEFDSDHDEPLSHLDGTAYGAGDDISLFDEPPAAAEAAPPTGVGTEDSAGLYALLREQANGEVLVRHLRFVVKRAFSEAGQKAFRQLYPEDRLVDEQPLSEEQMLNILQRLYVADNAGVQSSEEPTAVSSPISSPALSPDDSEDDVEYGFGDDDGSDDDGDDDPAAAHMKRMLQVWKMRSEDSGRRVSARRISTTLKKDAFN